MNNRSNIGCMEILFRVCGETVGNLKDQKVRGYAIEGRNQNGHTTMRKSSNNLVQNSIDTTKNTIKIPSPSLALPIQIYSKNK